MSNNNLDNFQKQAAEEEFLRLAALEIESEQNEIFLDAQELPDPAPEVLQQLHAGLIENIHKNRTQQRRHRIFLQIRRLTACAAVICCLAVTGIYFSVDAARLSINNFVLDLFDGHAVVQTDASKAQEGATLPADWSGPFSVNWVPPRFTTVQAGDFQTFWKLIYTDSTSEENLSVYVWDSFHAPNINAEGLQLISEEDIQGSSANIYASSSDETHMLIWVKEDYIVQIGGTISPEEAKKIAENFFF